jgi:hypothetical protein
MPHHFPAPPPSMISPQKTKSPCFQPRFFKSGLDLRRPLPLQRAELPGTCFRSNLSAASRTANRCLIILIIDTDQLVRDRQLTRIHPLRVNASCMAETGTSDYYLNQTCLAQASGCVLSAQPACQQHILARRDCSVGLGTRGRSPAAFAHRHGRPFSVVRRLPRLQHRAYIASTPTSARR